MLVSFLMRWEKPTSLGPGAAWRSVFIHSTLHLHNLHSLHAYRQQRNYQSMEEKEKHGPLPGHMHKRTHARMRASMYTAHARARERTLQTQKHEVGGWQKKERGKEEEEDDEEENQGG